VNATAKSLGVDRMSVDDRLRLIEEIWDTIDAEELPFPDSHREELDRRLAAADAHPEAAIPWDEVLARLKQKP
jgi:putative addiction module component (TIGR02574 family)